MGALIENLLALPLPATFLVLSIGILRAMGALFGLWGIYFILGPAVVLRSVLATVIAGPIIVGYSADFVALASDTPRFELLVIPMREFIIGFGLGMLVSLPFFSIMGAAMLIDQYRGDFSPGIQAPEQLTIGSYGALNMVMVLFVFVEAGGFLVMVSVLYDSYAVFPPAVPGLSLGEGFGESIGRIVASIMSALVVFAMPVVLILILLEIGMNLTHRMSEGIKVPSIDFLVKNLAMVLLMPVLVIGLFRMMETAFERSPAPLQIALEIFGP